MEKEKQTTVQAFDQTTSQSEEFQSYEVIPPEILENMTPEIRQQYFLWDEMLKKQIQLYPEMLFPLIREIFGKEYPAGTSIKLLSTEYVLDSVLEHGEKRIRSVRSDLLIQVGGTDIYHMECQIKQGSRMAVRMLEYDTGIALVHGVERTEPEQKGKKGKYHLKFPKSVILYLSATEKTPDAESCMVTLPDGTKYEYSIPILKVQSYTPAMLEEKKLNILFPFTPIRFQRRFETILKERESPAKAGKASEKMETLKKDLTNFLSECIMIIYREEENGTLGRIAGKDMVEFLIKACDHLFFREPELLREVHKVMEPAIKLYREEIEEQKEAAIKKLEEAKEADVVIQEE